MLPFGVRMQVVEQQVPKVSPKYLKPADIMQIDVALPSHSQHRRLHLTAAYPQA